MVLPQLVFDDDNILKSVFVREIMMFGNLSMISSIGDFFNGGFCRGRFCHRRIYHGGFCHGGFCRGGCCPEGFYHQ